MSPDQRMAGGLSNRSTEVADDNVAPAPERQRLELSIPQLLAGALAAASAAVAASWLGVAGTVTGAVVASVVVSVSSALYKHSLERSTQVIRETLPVLPVLPERYRNGHGTSPTETIEATPPAKPERGSSPANARRIRWGVVAVSSLLTLIVGFGILTAVEVVIGRSAEQLTGHDQGGGTTVGQIFNHKSSKSGNDTKPSTPANTSSTGGSSTAPSTTAPATTAPTTEPPTTVPPSTTAPSTTAPPSTGQTTQPPISQPPASSGGPS